MAEFRLRGVPSVLETVAEDDQALTAAQQAARAVWIGWTTASAQSPRIIADAAEANGRGALFQALLDPVAVPSPVDQWPVYDLRDFNGAPYHEAMTDMTERMRHRSSRGGSYVMRQSPAVVPGRDSLISGARPKVMNLASPWVIAALVALSIIGLTLIAEVLGLTAGPRVRWWNQVEPPPASQQGEP